MLAGVPRRCGVASPAMAATAPTLRKALQGRSPSLAYERALWDAGHEVVVGIDEVGRGAWAGPLTVGAAVLPRDRRVYKVRDSKQLTEAEREALFDRIAGWCVAWAVGHAIAEECDELGMSEAQRLAARRAIEGLGVRARPRAARRQVGLRGRRHRPAHRQGRRPLPVDLGGVDPGQGDPRPHHAGRGRALPAVVVRPEQGLPVPAPQGGAPRRRAVGHPPPELGVHGHAAVGRRPAPRPPRPAGLAVRLTRGGAGYGLSVADEPDVITTTPTTATTATISSRSSDCRTTSRR